MADNNKTVKKENSATNKSTTPGKSSHKKTSSKKEPTTQFSAMKPTTLLSVAAIIIAVLALIEGFYIGSKTQRTDYSEAKTTTALSATIDDQKRQLADLNQKLTELKTTLEKNTVQAGDNAASIQTIKDAKDLDDSHWVLVDVKHLLNMANYYLVLAPAPNTALAILEKANKQLTALNEPKTLKLQQAIYQCHY